MYHVVTSDVEYFDQFDDYFKDQINISWIIFDDQEKNKKQKVGKKISGRVFKSGCHDFFISGIVPENTKKIWGKTSDR